MHCRRFVVLAPRFCWDVGIARLCSGYYQSYSKVLLGRRIPRLLYALGTIKASLPYSTSFESKNVPLNHSLTIRRHQMITSSHNHLFLQIIIHYPYTHISSCKTPGIETLARTQLISIQYNSSSSLPSISFIIRRWNSIRSHPA